jgi:DNA-binding NtrC family response regulator
VVLKVTGHDTAQQATPVSICVGMTLQQAEALLIAATLRHTDGNMSAAAMILDINRTTMYAKVMRYNIRSQKGPLPPPDAAQTCSTPVSERLLPDEN